MKISYIQALPGANIYSHQPVLVMKLHLEDLAARESREFPGFNERLWSLLPGVRGHHCSKGYAGGFAERLEEGTYFGHIVEHVALELTELAGVPTFHGKTRQAGEPGCYFVVVEYKSEQGTEYLLRTAVELVQVLVRNEPFDLNRRLDEARRVIAQGELGPSTQAIVEAAARRGIPWRRVGDGSLIQLGYGRNRRMIQAAMTGGTSAIAVDIASDKELTKTLLRQAAIPVPYGMVVRTVREAAAAINELRPPYVVKPYDGCQGRGVSIKLRTTEQVERAFHIARQVSPKVVIEEQLQGRDYRALVVGGSLIAASERVPAHVVGDGQLTVAELIEVINQDPRRGEGHGKALTRITVDSVALECLRKAGLSLDSRPQPGEVVYLRECANLSTGGTARDVTNLVHPEVRRLCERAARVIGLDVCGIDLILPDITAPVGAGGIVEVNAAPGLRMHLAPSEGEQRDVGEAILETIYPRGGEGADGRIPIISITGTNGKTTITRMIGHLLASTGKTVGMTTTDGIYLNGECLVRGDTTGPRSAETILSDPSVAVAVLETARGGLVRGGLSYDWSDVSVISNVRLDHVGQDGIETLDDLLYIKSLVAERVREGGTLILNADDERLAQLMDIPRVNRVPKKVIYFSMHPLHVLIRRHLSQGGTAILYSHGWIVEAEGGRERRIVRAAEIPITLGGAASFHIANALAAAAAGRASGLPLEAIGQALKSFDGARHNEGRANLYQVAAHGGNGYVLVDYGHNPDAFAAISRMSSHWGERVVTGIIGVPGDRNDAVIEQAGRAAAEGFSRLIIKEDHDLRGRAPGEVPELLRRAAQAAAPGVPCQIVPDETKALALALQELRPGEVVVVFYEKLDPIQDVLQKFGAVPAHLIPDLPVEVKRRRLGAQRSAGLRLMQA